PNAPPPLPPAGAVDTGTFNPMLGYSYEELATLSRSMHHSQGTGAMRRPGPNPTPFSLVAGTIPPNSSDPFDGIDTTWNRFPGGAAIGQMMQQALNAFTPAHPENAIPMLAKARSLVAAIDNPLAKVKLAQLDEAIAKCAGIYAEAQTLTADVAPGTKLTLNATVLNRSTQAVNFDGAKLEGIW